ncbi:MAG: alpha-amylase [Candidatus Azobacteroides sp.]|nr:alpha-amylase [Candidatus Azobacteroides sp.]
MKKLITTGKLFLIVSLFVSIPFNGKAQVPDASPDVMLQGFYWNSHGETRWWDLNNQAQEISYFFDMVWLPPSAAGEGGNWANMGYHPYCWADQNSSWGSKDELKTLISSLRAGGCKAIADVIINYRSGNGWVDFPADEYGWPYVTYQFNYSHICKDDEAAAAGYPTGPNYDYNWNVYGDKWGGYAAARDLDHSQEYVRSAVKEYLWFLKNEIGYEGWRYDLVKGYNPWYTKEYNETLGNYFSVGEYYQSNYDDLKAWVDGTHRTSTVFDFCFKQAIYDWNGGSNYSLLAWTDPTTGKRRPAGLVHSPEMRKYAVTFIDNHDTASPHENPWEYTGNITRANAIMLAAPGIPCVF